MRVTSFKLNNNKILYPSSRGTVSMFKHFLLQFNHKLVLFSRLSDLSPTF